MVLHPRATLTSDVVGRYLLDANRIVNQPSTYTYRLRTDPTPQTTTRSLPATETANVKVVFGSAALKVNPVGRMLVVAGVLFSIGDNGLKDALTPVFGLEYDF